MKHYHSASAAELARINESIMQADVAHIPLFVKRCEPYAKAIRYQRNRGTSRAKVCELLTMLGVKITQNYVFAWERFNGLL